jgi:hypothetical protein
MSEPEWHATIERVTPYVVKVSTPGISGTGFLVSSSSSTDLCAIATAAHVVGHASYWDEPIRIDHHLSGTSVLLRQGDRAIRVHEQDTAAILFERKDLPFPPSVLELSDKGKYWKPGVEIGWLGFPSILQASLCFFSGRISAWVQQEDAYLVDGVTINGVSGGPAFMLWDGTLAGVVSAYIPNVSTGQVLPGLAVIRGVSHFHKIAEEFRSIDEAKAKETPPPAPPPPLDELVQTRTGSPPRYQT